MCMFFGWGTFPGPKSNIKKVVIKSYLITVLNFFLVAFLSILKKVKKKKIKKKGFLIVFSNLMQKGFFFCF